MIANTLYDKLWKRHVVHEESDGTALVYIDRHLVHEVTSPQAFEGLRVNGSQAVAPLPPFSPLPTTTCRPLQRAGGIADPIARLQVDTLR